MKYNASIYKIHTLYGSVFTMTHVHHWFCFNWVNNFEYSTVTGVIFGLSYQTFFRDIVYGINNDRHYWLENTWHCLQNMTITQRVFIAFSNCFHIRVQWEILHQILFLLFKTDLTLTEKLFFLYWEMTACLQLKNPNNNPNVFFGYIYCYLSFYV